MIPKDLKKIVLRENIFKFCTKPEMEILLIINENLINEFNKSKESPKDFAKRNIIYDDVRYNQSNVFLENYYSGKRINKLVDNIKKYKHMKKHDKDELYLADLLK